MGGGGAGFIKDLDDVDISGLADEYILQYDAATSKWLTVPNTGSVAIGGTIATDSVGIHTVKAVGIATTGARSGVSLFVEGNIEATGNITVGGTITYDDVTNDSIGLITARDGLQVLSGIVTIGSNISIPASSSGINTATNVLYVSKDGNDSNNGTSIDNAFLTIKAHVVWQQQKPPSEFLLVTMLRIIPSRFQHSVLSLAMIKELLRSSPTMQLAIYFM